MKKLLIIPCIALLFASCNNSSAVSKDQEETISESTTTETAPITTLTFQNSSHDFGTTKEGSVISHLYSFTNKSDRVITITKANASCGCTVPNWPKDPIQPGETGDIYVEFNSTGKQGKQTKTVRVYTDVQEDPIKLSLTGTVEAK